MNLIKRGLALDKYKSAGYIYMLQEREFVKTGEPVYKIGKTKNISQRMGKYPKNSLIILVLQVKNSDRFEVQLLNRFRRKFKLVLGREYFEGDRQEMIGVILNEYYCGGGYIEYDEKPKPGALSELLNVAASYIGNLWYKK